MTRAADQADAVHIAGLGSVACAAVPWRSAGQLRLTVVVKATFTIVPDGDMILASPADVHRADVPQRNNPTLSAHFARETAPYLQHADVLLTGAACAPEEAPVKALTVRFALFRDRTLFEKSIHVYGDRRGSEIVPFERMPLVYERAYGGLGHPDNPFGTGNKELSKPPNLVDPADPTRPVCFAPLSASWPTRKRLLNKPQHEGLRHPIPDIAADFDWSYFQAAPPDQRVEHLTGTEWVVLDGLHPQLTRVQSRLPGARAAARVFGLSDAGRGQPLGLVADMISVDVDELTCAVVWRAGFPIPSEDAFSAIHVIAGVETANAPLDWEAALAAVAPPAPDDAPTPPPASAPLGPKFEAVARTFDLDPVGEEATIQRKLPRALPQVVTMEEAPTPPKAPSAEDWAGTVELSSLGPAPAAKTALPFQASPQPSPGATGPFLAPLPPPRPPPLPSPSRPRAPPVPPPPPAPRDPDEWAGTVELSSLPAAAVALPFATPAVAPPGAPSPGPAPLPALPHPPAMDWGQTADVAFDAPPRADPRPLPFVHGVANLPPPAPLVAESPFTGTVGLGDEPASHLTLPFRRAPTLPRELPPPPAAPPPLVFEPAFTAPPSSAPLPAAANVEPPAFLGAPRAVEPPPAAEPPPAVALLVAEPPAAPAPKAPRAMAKRPPMRPDHDGGAPPPPPPRNPSPKPLPRRAPEPPPRPPPPPKPNVNAGLYKRFDEPDK